MLRPLYVPELNSLCLVPVADSDCYPKALEPFVEQTVAEVERDQGVYTTTSSLPLANREGEREIREKSFVLYQPHPYTDSGDISHVVAS